MQVSAIGSLDDILEDLGGNEYCVVLTGNADEIKAAAVHFLSQVTLTTPGTMNAIREAAERRDYAAVLAMTEPAQ